jgi:tetratricopeptide (TPR) repeat protein
MIAVRLAGLCFAGLAIGWSACAVAQGPPAGVISRGGVAIGGNVQHSTVTVGISAESARGLVDASSKRWRSLTDSQRKELRELESRLGITVGALQTFFATLGQNNVAVQDLPARLGEIAGQYLALKQQLQIGPTDGPEISRVKKQAQDALTAGNLDEADKLLARVGELQDLDLTKRISERAATAAQRGTLAMSQLRYRDAANFFKQAAGFAATDRAARLGYLRQEAVALAEVGSAFGEDSARNEAIAKFKVLAEAREKSAEPLEWAKAQWDLATALTQSAAYEASPSEYQDALRHYELSLQGISRETEPEQWARAKAAIGIARCMLGSQKLDASMLKTGMGELQEALTYYGVQKTKDRIQAAHGLAACESWFAATEADLKFTEQAINRIKGILAEENLQVEPMNIVELEMNLATLQYLIGREKKDFNSLEEAEKHLRSALGRITKESTPVRWAELQWSLSAILYEASFYHRSIGPLQDAIEANRAASSVFTREKFFPFWIELEIYKAEIESWLAIATRRPETARDAAAAVAAIRAASGSAPADLDRAWVAEMLARIEQRLEKAKGLPPFPKEVAPDKEDKIKFSLVQLTWPPAQPAGPPPDLAARAAALKTRIQDKPICRQPAQVAREIGSEVVVNDAIPAKDLPASLRARVASTPIGGMTDPFGTAEVSVLVVCGRTQEQ